MFGIFKRKKTEFTKYFPDQRPGERIHNVVSEYIRPILEQNGFKMLKSELTFKKKLSKFEQEIHFRKSRHNRANEMVRFDIGFIVTSNYYKKWLNEIYGDKWADNTILGSNANHIPNWNKKALKSISWYDLATDDNSVIVDMVNYNVKNNGLEFLNNLSDFEVSVDYIMGMERYARTPMLMDFCEIVNNREKAKEVLNWFEHYKNRTNKEFSEDTLKEVELRKERLKTGYNNGNRCTRS